MARMAPGRWSLPNPEAPNPDAPGADLASCERPGLDEFAAIARYFAPLAAGFPGAYGLLDDAATLPSLPGRDVVVTLDTLVEDVHFLTSDPADSVAAKVLAVNLSDLAAMGARPLAYLLSLSLPRARVTAGIEGWLEAFAAGLRRTQERYRVHLIGGDTVATPGPLSLSVTALGDVAAGRALRRAGARVGDDVYVTGSIGDAALGLAVLQGRLMTADAAVLIDRYRTPQPRIAAGLALVGLAHACADVSDGLIADLGHICTASAVTATLDARLVPASPAVRAALALDPALLATVLGGGDDYELVFTAAPAAAPRVAEAARAAGVAMTAIGRIEPALPSSGQPALPGRAGVVVLGLDGVPLAPVTAGYRHF